MRRNTLGTILLLAMAFLLLTSCSQSALTGPRVEVAGMSFILPEGWEYETDKFAPSDKEETFIYLYPADLEREQWWGGFLCLFNATSYSEQPAGSTVLQTYYEAGMTVDEWAEARLAGLRESRPADIYHYELKKVSDDVRAIYCTTTNEEPDSALYLRVADGGLAVWLVDDGRAGFGAKEQALLVKVLESVEK